MWLYALLALLALAAGLMTWWSFGNVLLRRNPNSISQHALCKTHSSTVPNSSQHSSAAAPPAGQPPECVTLRVFGLHLGSRNTAPAAVRKLFQSLLGPAAALPTLATGIPWRSRGGRWAVSVAVSPGTAAAIRKHQPSLAKAQHTARVSIYHHPPQEGRRRRPHPSVAHPPPSKPSTSTGHRYRAGVRDPHHHQHPPPPPMAGQPPSVGGLTGPGLLPVAASTLGHHPWSYHAAHYLQQQPTPITSQPTTHLPPPGQPLLPTATWPPPEPPASFLLSLLQQAWQQQARLELAVGGLVSQVKHQHMGGGLLCTPAGTTMPTCETPVPPPQPTATPAPPPPPQRPARPQPLGRLSMLMALRGHQPPGHEQQVASPRSAAAAFLAELTPAVPPLQQAEGRPPHPPSPHMPGLVTPPPVPLPHSPPPSPPYSPPRPTNPLFVPLPPSPPPSPPADLQPPPFPPPKGADWAVIRVLGHQLDTKGNLHYWVQWADSWVTGSQLVGDLEAKYWQQRGEDPPPCAPAAGFRQGRSAGERAQHRRQQQQPPEQRAGHSSPQALD